MANNVHTIQEFTDDREGFSQWLMAQAIQNGLKTEHPFWDGVRWFLDWARNIVTSFLTDKLAKLPMVGQWAPRISTPIVDFIFKVIATTINFMKLSFAAPEVWQCMRNEAQRAWDAKADQGILAQTYAYGKKMAAHFLEILKQCLQRAIRATGLQLEPEERENLTQILDDLLQAPL